MKDPLNVLCFGEVLWDVLPAGRHAGGAPMNVAYHLNRLGIKGWPVSSVGDDDLGRELLTQLQEWGLPGDLISVTASRPTGTVEVTLEAGSPSYEIVENVAWDRIGIPGSMPAGSVPAAAIVFGSLALREAHNSRSLGALFQSSPSALRIFDVNLRPPFDDPGRVWRLAGGADVVKLNDEELATLLELPDVVDTESAVRRFASRADSERVCVTCGANGAGLLDRGTWHWVESRPVTVNDTIGAGDAFLAALLYGILTSPERPGDNLTFASHLAGYVAASEGATPDYRIGDDRSISPASGSMPA